MLRRYPRGARGVRGGGQLPRERRGHRGGSSARGEKLSPCPRSPADGIVTFRPERPVTQPTRTGSSPALFSAAIAACCLAGETIMHKPMPMLKVAYIVAAGT